MATSYIRFKVFTGSDIGVVGTVELNMGSVIPRVGELVHLPGMPPLSVYEVHHVYEQQLNVDVYLKRWEQS